VERVLPARPEALSITPERTAVLLVDMQNAFASKGGMLDLAGIDVAEAGQAVANARRLADAARAAGIPVIYLVMGYAPDQSNAGGEDSPNPRKELALCLMRERPELRGKLLTYGSWDYKIVDALTPHPGELVITKSRYSGFVGTPLDAELRSRGIRTLLMAGIASNVCVESTLRDAYFHEYWPVMIEDATMPAGSPEIQQATVHNVTTFFGWVATVSDVADTLRGIVGQAKNPEL
jgi:ureidoacrylate peracid hydrolase